VCVEWLVAALLALPGWYGDRGDSAGERASLYRPVAVAICAATVDKWERRALAAQAYAETRLARYVLEDRCSDGPVGQRCDGGRATGPWQVHGFCSAAWAPGKKETRRMLPHKRLVAGARCALRIGALGRCRWGEAGWFQSQRAVRPPRVWAHKRVVLMERVR
jgi:hypothetical protein